jgi:hypothetical protein
MRQNLHCRPHILEKTRWSGQKPNRKKFPFFARTSFLHSTKALKCYLPFSRLISPRPQGSGTKLRPNEFMMPHSQKIVSKPRGQNSAPTPLGKQSACATPTELRCAVHLCDAVLICNYMLVVKGDHLIPRVPYLRAFVSLTTLYSSNAPRCCWILYLLMDISYITTK